MKTAEKILRLTVRAVQAIMVLAPVAQAAYYSLRDRLRREEGAQK